MLNQIKARLQSLAAQALSLSGLPAICVGAAIGYFGHPVIKLAIDGVRLLLKL